MFHIEPLVHFKICTHTPPPSPPPPPPPHTHTNFWKHAWTRVLSRLAGWVISPLKLKLVPGILG